jgi:ribonuclease-3
MDKSKNYEITSGDIKNILAKLDIYDVEVNDISVYQKAFVHKSCAKKDHLDSYEVLEFKGDSIIGMYCALYLSERFPGKDEGFYTKNKAKLVKRDKLAEYSRFLGLDDFLLLRDNGDNIISGKNNNKFLEEIFESFVGSMFQDNNGSDWDNMEHALAICKTFFKRTMEYTTDFTEIVKTNDNFKDNMMQMYQQFFKGQHYPNYTYTSVGPPNDRMFTVSLINPFDETNIVAIGKGRKKLDAEQETAKNGIDNIKHLFDKHKIQPKIADQ